MTQEEKLFSAIGGLPDSLVDEAADPGEPGAKRSAWPRWGALAAALVLVVGLVRFFPRMGAFGGNAGGAGISASSAAPGEAAFMSYAGPVLPLTVLEGPENLPATREVTWSFPATVDTEVYSIRVAQVTDTTVVTNNQTEELKVVFGYPVSADFRTAEEQLPTVTVDGKVQETTLVWGERPVGEELSAWSPRIESWQDYVTLLEGNAALDAALEPAPALEQTVTVWEFLDEDAPEVPGGAPTLAVTFHIDPEKTKVYPLGFNGMDLSEDGTVRYSFFVRRDGERKQRRLLVFVGEAPEEYVMGGYENGGCDRVLEGISARVTGLTTTLGELLDRLAEEELPDWIEQSLSRRLEDFRNALRRTMSRCLPGQPGENGFYMLEDIFSHTLTETRVVWSAAEVTIPAGESVTVTVRYEKEPSYDFACANTERRGLGGWDLASRLGSNLDFRRLTARLENIQHLELVRNDFGFDQEEGVLTVELSPQKEHYAMELRVKQGF